MRGSSGTSASDCRSVDSVTQRLGYAEARELLGRLGPMAEHLVLIGGQAVNFWAERYLARSPELAQWGPFASKDVDFCGSAQSAQEAARVLGGICKVPSLDDMTPCTALVQYEDGGVPRQIDFLGAPYGLRPEDVRSRSLPVQVETTHGAVKFRVLHPLHCLESRVQNVHALPGYDNERSLRQLRAAIVCMREFARELLDSGKTRDVLRLNERVFAFAIGAPSLSVWARHGVSVFDAVLRDPRLPEAFERVRYPQMHRELHARQDKLRQRADSPRTPAEEEVFVVESIDLRGTKLVASLRAPDGTLRELPDFRQGPVDISQGDRVRVRSGGGLELVQRAPDRGLDR
jgi:hypothetical protein